MLDQETYDELSLYTLSLRDPAFIHQYIVDAYAAQHADRNTKPITLAFALIGLYLHIEKGYSGRDVQLAHIKMAKEKKTWPAFNFPVDRGAMTVEDVLKIPAGSQRNEAIKSWSRSVWQAWSEGHEQVRTLTKQELHI